MSKVTIYHNPRCRKSREALEILQHACTDLHIVDYQKTPLSEKQIAELVNKLAISPEQLIRKGEEIYKSKYKGKTLSDKEWITAIAENPILMERPVIVSGEKAVIARPAEKVNVIL